MGSGNLGSEGSNTGKIEGSSHGTQSAGTGDKEYVSYSFDPSSSRTVYAYLFLCLTFGYIEVLVLMKQISPDLRPVRRQ